MRQRIPEIFTRPARQAYDRIRISGALAIMGAEVGYLVIDDNGLNATEQAVLYPGAAAAILMLSMPLARFGDSYFQNYDDQGRRRIS